MSNRSHLSESTWFFSTSPLRSKPRGCRPVLFLSSRPRKTSFSMHTLNGHLSKTGRRNADARIACSNYRHAALDTQYSTQSNETLYNSTARAEASVSWLLKIVQRIPLEESVVWFKTRQAIRKYTKIYIKFQKGSEGVWVDMLRNSLYELVWAAAVLKQKTSVLWHWSSCFFRLSAGGAF